MQSVADLNLDSYVWQPWFATLSGGAGVAYERRSGRTGDEGDAIRFNGDLALSVLPQSRFPTQFSFSRIDNRVSGGFLGSDFVQNRFTASTTSIITSKFRTNLGAAFDWSEQNRLGDRRSKRLYGGAVRTFGDNFAGVQSISAHVDYTDSEFNSIREGDLSEDILTANLVIQSKPAEDMQNQLAISYIRDDDVSRTITSNRRSLQAVNSFSWNPADRKYNVDGFIRARIEEIDFDTGSGAATRRNDQLLGVGNVKFPVGERLFLRVGVRGGVDGRGDNTRQLLADPGGDRKFAAVNGSLNYFSRTRNWGDYEWRWGARAFGETGWANQDNVLRKPSGAVNHTLERDLDIFGENASRIAFTQEVGFDAGAVDRDRNDSATFTPIVSHGLSFTHSRTDRAGATSFRIVARDLRELAGERDTLQTAQVQFNRRQVIDARRSFTGAVTANVLRRNLNEDSETFVTATGRLIYAHRSLFDLRNLDYRSELAVNLFELDELFSDDPTPTVAEDIQHHEWRNILTYHIGKIAVVAEASGFYEDEGFGDLFLFRIRRDIGGN